ncbi:carbon starvation protein A [Ornithinibacillus massiliensis]|uniref:Carbon starvation protein A n=1 Tax=Ornithinibacillus massiliensis TaxID=1944633 RepID=A0ABS5MFT6_9BACI|nr:carbon starvation protein A [Ornithinibacillus massiliensis]MBS3680938.1 carbon starvation protein A [Ornithinibacillus massiliensis]
MITFIVAIALLITAYFTYGKYVEKVFRPNANRPTPAYANQDGVDYVPMNKQKNALIQLLNIAGTGPIFGPIMGALYGPVAFLWIVLGSIFAGAVHDYLTGMISIRNRGAHIPELAGKFLGKLSRHLVNVFALLLLLLVGTVFVTTPASLLHNLIDGKIALIAIILLIFSYFILSTILPIDKIIGRVYPFFGAVLIIGSIGVGIALLLSDYTIPELSLTNMHPADLPILPILFLTITCGALSGFHATQSPLISRTTQNEKQGRYIFYGMMVAEGVIAMIWAAAAMSLFDGQGLQGLINEGTASLVVNEVSMTLLGAVGGTIAVLGAVVLPITSGDTAFRAARNIIADYIRMSQTKMGKRLMIALPMFAVSYWLTTIDFNLLWRYFSFANQGTAALALWIGTMYLFVKKKNYFISLIPALFITDMVLTYILYDSNLGFGLSYSAAHTGGIIMTMLITALFFWKGNKNRKENLVVDMEVPSNQNVA